MKMWKNQHPPGNMAVLVNAPRTGLKTFEDAQEASGRASLHLPRAVAQIDRIQFAAVDEDRREHVEKHQRDHRRREAGVIDDIGVGESAR